MQFKHAIVLAAVAFCAVQAASMEEHERNRRSASNLFDQASQFVNSMKDKVTNNVSEGLAKVLGTFDKIEDNIVDATSKLMSKAGFKFDIEGLLATFKSNFKNCAVSDSVKSQAAAIKDEFLSCVGGDVEKIQEIVADVTELASDDSAPAALENAATICKGEPGQSFGLDRMGKCVSALKIVTDDATIAKVPGAITKNVARANEIIANMKATGINCLTEKVKKTGSNLVNIAKSVASCVRAG